MTMESLRDYIARKQDQIDELMKQYSGVRPAWVGEEIGILSMYKRDAENKLKKLEEEHGKD